MINKIIKKIPYVKKRLSIINPSIETILLHLVNSNEKLTILDVGANLGQSIEFFTKQFPNAFIYSFEPTKSLIFELESKFKNNNKINIFPIGLGDRDEEVEFYESSNNATNSCLKPNILQYESFKSSLTKTLQNSTKNIIELKKLDTWHVENIKEKEIDIIKMDVQGFEYQVICGGVNTLKEQTKIIYFEIQYIDFYENTIPFYKIFEKLYELGFYYYCQINSTKRNKFQIIESDVVFINGKFIPPNK